MPESPPAQRQGGGFPPRDEVIEQLGEDPGVIVRKGERTAAARIRGVEDLTLLEAYQEAEMKCPSGPRKRVMAAINKRREELRKRADKAGDEE
jgi:hypothetical protein